MRRGFVAFLGLALLGASTASAEGPEVFTWDNVSPVDFWNNKRNLSAAWDGSSFFYVWDDERFGNEGIFGVRMAPDGTLRDPTGIPLSVGSSRRRNPSVAFDGTNFVVVWQDDRSGKWDVYAERVTPAGQIVPGSEIPISSGPFEEIDPQVIRTATETVIVWADARADSINFDIYATTLSTSGVVGNPNGVPVCTASGIQRAPQLGTDGTNVLVTWEDERGASVDPYATILAPGLSVVTPDGVDLANGPEDIAELYVGFGAGKFHVLWSVNRGTQWDIQLLRLDPSGTPVDAAPIDISTSPDDEGSASIAFDGTRFLVGWANQTVDDLRATFLWQDGTVVTPGGDTVSTSYGPIRTRILFAAGFYAYAFNSDGDVYLRPFDLNGQPLDDGFRLGISPARQYSPGAAFDGTHYLVAWLEDSPDGPVLYARRYDRSGAPVDPAPTFVNLANATDDPIRVASNGQSFLIVYRGNQWKALESALVGSDGKVIATNTVATPSTVNGPQRPSSVASNGIDYLVVFGDDTSGDQQVRATRVSAAGVVQDPGGVLVTDMPPQADMPWPDVAWDGAEYWAIWRDDRTCWRCEIRGARINSAGAVVDPGGKVLVPDGASGRVDFPRIAFGNGVGLITWESDAAGNLDVVASRMTTAGVVQDTTPITVSSAPDDQSRSRVAWNGSTFVASWLDERGADEDVYLARVGTDGVVKDGAGGVPLSANVGPDFPGAMVSDQQGTTAILYTRLVNAPTTTLRARGQLAAWDVPQGGGCFADGQCATGHCADGVCCDTACGGGASNDCNACSVAAGAPANGTCVALTACMPDTAVGPPKFASEPVGTAACESWWRYSDAGPIVEGERPITFSVRADGDEALPPDLYVDPSSGQVLWHTEKGAEGEHHFLLVATNARGETTQKVTVTVDCAKPHGLAVSCGCDAGEGAAGFGASVVALLAASRRRRRVRGS